MTTETPDQPIARWTDFDAETLAYINERLEAAGCESTIEDGGVEFSPQWLADELRIAGQDLAMDMRLVMERRHPELEILP